MEVRARGTEKLGGVLQQLRELIAEHKPHIDKMKKTGPQLLELSPGEGFSIQEKYVVAETLYSQIKEEVKKRAVALDEAMSQSTQVTLYPRDKSEFLPRCFPGPPH
jgi:hypothetical protein